MDKKALANLGKSLEKAVAVLSDQFAVPPATPEEAKQRESLIRDLGATVKNYTRAVEAFAAKAARDPKEPGRKEKEQAAERLARVVGAHFRRQFETIQKKMSAWYPERKYFKAAPTWLDDPDLWDDPEFEADLVILLTEAARQGVELFGSQIGITGLDYTLTNAEAAKWAAEHAGELIKEINKTSLEAVRYAVTNFIDTPGMTIGQVMDLLPFNESRRLTIATNEITVSYAKGNRLAAEGLKRDNPDVRIVKTWFTNRDDKVCPLCAPLDGVTVEMDEEFAPGIMEPGDPHIGCLCWISYRTDILGGKNAGS